MLEKLLNQLIEKWRKPRGCDTLDRHSLEIVRWKISMVIKWINCIYSLNDLCSLDSWLWQFVCNNWLYGKYNEWANRYYWVVFCYANRQTEINREDDLEYRIMLSSIQDDKEQFLIENIKLDAKR
jgi:hypothetical protein